jgi:hypothetical protein
MMGMQGPDNREYICILIRVYIYLCISIFIYKYIYT